MTELQHPCTYYFPVMLSQAVCLSSGSGREVEANLFISSVPRLILYLVSLYYEVINLMNYMYNHLINSNLNPSGVSIWNYIIFAASLNKATFVSINENCSDAHAVDNNVEYWITDGNWLNIFIPRLISISMYLCL